LQKISPEGILKSAKEEAENAANAFEKISIKVNELKNSLDGLESSYDKIENLTEGTLEWY
jgi:predicted translin family RNA/ssDNA-binding protein